MVALILFMTKPIWYLLAFTLAARYFASCGPHWQLRTSAVVVLATIVRYGAGWGSGMLATALGRSIGHGLFFVILIGCGLALWWLVARIAFRRAPTTELLEFAVLAEVISLGIDLLALREVSHINMC
jgi:hypothetical protein